MNYKTLDVPTRHGTMRVIDGDVWVSRSLYVLGEYSQLELQAMEVILRTLRSKMREGEELSIVEAGAYIGDLTVPLSRLVDKVYAFEPQYEVYKILSHNLEVNGCTNVEVFPYALSHQNGETYFDPEQDAGSPGSKMMGQEKGTKVEMRTLDSLGLSPSFIKLDAEGMEIHILGGAIETIKRCRPTLFLECDTVSAEGVMALPEVLELLNYHHYKMEFPMWWPGNFNQAHDPLNRFETTSSFMTLAIPR